MDSADVSRSRWRRRGAGGVALAIAALVLPALAVGPAAADVEQPGGTGYSVTYAARICDSYADVQANKQRNNLMEALRDLGADSTYPYSGVVTAEAEASGSPNCRALEGWRFSAGNDWSSKTSDTLNLSTVRGVDAVDIVTGASTPLLDSAGDATGQNLAGAVTVPISAAQLQRLNTGGNLWVQSGTPAAPLNGQQTENGFAALRCSQDALNGDNVERVWIPAGQRHLFCFAYLVSPPPESGTIIVEKQIAANSNGAGTFRFDGNLSYADSNGDGTDDFTLTAANGTSGSQTFIRGAVGAGDPAWSFREVSTPGWDPPSTPACTSTGSSTIEIDQVTFEVAIRLAAGDTVRCVVTNSRVTTGATSLAIESVGGIGSFPASVTTPDPDPDYSGTVVTVAEGAPVDAWSSDSGTLGAYTFSEELPPATAAGSWALQSFGCNGSDYTDLVTTTGQVQSATLSIITPSTNHCLFVNEFTPSGSIAITKTTIGGTGAFDFIIVPVDDEGNPLSETAYEATATTTAVGTPVTAAPVGAPATGLVVEPQRRYLIQEQQPAGSELGSWQNTDVDCGASPAADAGNGSFIVTLSVDAPTVTCAFTNTFNPTGRFQVDLETTTDPTLRPAAAGLTVTCEGGTTFDVDAASEVASASSGPYVVFGDDSCVVEQVAVGEAAGTTVRRSATISVDGGDPVPFDVATERAAVAAGRDVLVVVTNVIIPPTSTPTPTTSPTLPTSDGGTTPDPPTAAGGSRLPATGSALASPLLFTAFALLALGLGIGAARLRAR